MEYGSNQIGGHRVAIPKSFETASHFLALVLALLDLVTLTFSFYPGELLYEYWSHIRR